MEWRPVVGYEDRYIVSDDGLVASKEGRLLSRYVRVGYWGVSLWKNKKKKQHYVHRLVAESFIGPPPEPGWHVDHINFDITDTRVENLRWLSPQTNLAQKPPRWRHGSLKLTLQQANEVRRKYSTPPRPPLREIATEYGVGIAVIENVLSGRTHRQDPLTEAARLAWEQNKGWRARTQNQGNTKFSDAVIAEIRAKKAENRKWRLREIAAEYGISMSYAWNVVHGKVR